MFQTKTQFPVKFETRGSYFPTNETLIKNDDYNLTHIGTDSEKETKKNQPWKVTDLQV